MKLKINQHANLEHLLSTHPIRMDGNIAIDEWDAVTNERDGGKSKANKDFFNRRKQRLASEKKRNCLWCMDEL